MKIWGLGALLRIRRLRKVMSNFDAIKFCLAERRADDISFVLHPTGAFINLRGGSTDIRTFETVFLGREYEPPFPIMPKTIVDGGANIGMATLYFANRFPAAKIIAVEPETENAKRLRSTCSKLPNVTIIQAALWPEKSNVGLFDVGRGAYAYSVNQNRGAKSIATVPTVTMQELLERLGGQIDLLKLDVEGAERELFSQNLDWHLLSYMIALCPDAHRLFILRWFRDHFVKNREAIPLSSVFPQLRKRRKKFAPKSLSTCSN
jgi:FkbM family methyltransferase